MIVTVVRAMGNFYKNTRGIDFVESAWEAKSKLRLLGQEERLQERAYKSTHLWSARGVHKCKQNLSAPKCATIILLARLRANARARFQTFTLARSQTHAHRHTYMHE